MYKHKHQFLLSLTSSISISCPLRHISGTIAGSHIVPYLQRRSDQLTAFGAQKKTGDNGIETDPG